jgi:polysaccharide pyruvyl transferase WcaK-like protein
MEDIDLVLLGGGGLSFGYGYGIVANAFRLGVPVLYYGVSIHTDVIHSEIFKDFSKYFSEIIVRSPRVSQVLQENGIENTLSFCPSVYASMLPPPALPNHYILVTPCLYDTDTDLQVDSIIKTIEPYMESHEIIMVPFSRTNLDDVPIDLRICQMVETSDKRIKVADWNGFRCDQTKSLFRGADAVVNTGRYHSAVFAMESCVPMIYSRHDSDTKVGLSDIFKIQDLLSEFGYTEFPIWGQKPILYMWDKNKVKEILRRSELLIEILKRYV